ncbi:hypothetical protein [Streptomyces chrestomyceticus]|uniref:hypothetical protein n=1 Tax=Streptomyces chrestomyceticus TaxID=68185 RepID=UPI0033D7E367
MSISSMFSSPEAQNPSTAAVVKRTQALLDGGGRAGADPIEALRQLRASLPDLDDVRPVAEDDTSALSETELRQKEQTEGAIRTAVAAGNEAIWIVAEGMQRAAKGKWWRASHATYEAYVRDLTGRSASYVRRLRAGAPLALETASRTGRAQNPGQNEETRKVAKQFGTEAAVMFFDVVSEVVEELGGQATAEDLRIAREELPAALPEVPGQQRAEVERAARRALGHGTEAASDGEAEETESNNSNSGVRIRTPEDADGEQQAGVAGGGEGDAEDEIIDAEIVPEPVVALKEAIKTLTALNKAISNDTFTQAAQEGEAKEYAELRNRFLTKATALQKKALRAPAVYAPAPACGACGTAAVPSAADATPGRAGAYWWCPTCETTQGDRKPL